MTQTALLGFEHREGTFLSVGQVAVLYGVDERTVQYWETRGWFKRDKRGEYRLEDVVPGVYNAQQSLINMKKGPEGDEMKGLELREQSAKTQKAEIEVARLQGSLMDVEEVRKEIFERARSLRDALENIPARLGDILAAETDTHKIKSLLKTEFHELLKDETGDDH